MFIYQPKSGDRVFAEHTSDWIRVIRWGNGCRHVLGGVHLSFGAASPNEHWRNEACRLATAIVAATSGVGWDVRGTINLIVPVHQAFRAHELMCAEGQKHCQRVRADDNVTALIVAGAAQFDGLHSIVPVCVDPQPGKVAADWTATYKDWTPEEVSGGLVAELVEST